MILEKKGPVFSRFSIRHLNDLNMEELKDHDEKVWNYWRTVRKVVEYRELLEDG
mgnify:CR=1 FL=1